MDNRPVYYSQVDPRWRNLPYNNGGTGTIGTSGCGPTTASMIIATWRDPKITPVEICKWSVDHGYRTRDNGTYRSMFYGIGTQWNLKFREVYDAASAKQCLDAGGLVACHVGPGRWTSGGHYILWWKYEGNTVYINDPSGNTTKRNTGTLAELMACRKAFICFWPPEKESEEPDMTEERFRELFAECFETSMLQYQQGKEFDTLETVPEWARPSVEKAMKTPRKDDPSKMLLEGGTNGELNLTIDMLRMIVLNDRAGMYEGGCADGRA